MLSILLPPPHPLALHLLPFPLAFLFLLPHSPLPHLIFFSSLSPPSPLTVGEDYFNVSTVVSFAPEQSQATVTVLLAPDDVFPEPNKTFELFLSPSEGIYITPFAAATVTILNDDPDLPGRHTKFQSRQHGTTCLRKYFFRKK